ncbi:histidine kinase, partial [Nonomuraea sp. B12E4]|uniref:histidine kinase n=1 Tax=Nonomuraea sp. B12E4 TaxID=3153564 RepID=UPI00325C735C
LTLTATTSPTCTGSRHRPIMGTSPRSTPLPAGQEDPRLPSGRGVVSGLVAYTPAWADYFSFALTIALSPALPVAVGNVVRLREEMAQRNAQEAAKHAVRAERRRIARELHDVIAHHVSVVSLYMGVARRTIPIDPEQAQETLLTGDSGPGHNCQPCVHDHLARRPRRPALPELEGRQPRARPAVPPLPEALVPRHLQPSPADEQHGRETEITNRRPHLGERVHDRRQSRRNPASARADDQRNPGVPLHRDLLPVRGVDDEPQGPDCGRRDDQRREHAYQAARMPPQRPPCQPRHLTTSDPGLGRDRARVPARFLGLSSSVPVMAVPLLGRWTDSAAVLRSSRTA